MPTQTPLDAPPWCQRSALIEDVEWLADTGESRCLAARRLGMTPTALQRALARAGRSDLWQRLTGPAA